MSDKYAVIIPTRNRSEILMQTLQSVYQQSIPLEVFVMDDASSDDTPQRVKKEFPRARYFREENNKGPTFQRNKAAQMTDAKFLFTLDDDCILVSPDSFSQTLAGFNHPRIAAVTIPHINVRFGSQLLHAARLGPDVIECYFDYYGGMIAFRRDVFVGVGGYRNYLFMHVEETELAIRIMNAGYVIRLGRADPLNHLESPIRNNARLSRLEARNHILYTWYNVPWPIFPAHLAVTAIRSLGPRNRKGHFFRGLQGIAQGLSGIIHEFNQRKPVTQDVYKLTRRLRSEHSLPFDEIEPLLPPMRDFSNL